MELASHPVVSSFAVAVILNHFDPSSDLGFRTFQMSGTGTFTHFPVLAGWDGRMLAGDPVAKF